MAEVAGIVTGNGDRLLGVPLGKRIDVSGPLKVCAAAASPLKQLASPEYDGAIVVFATPHIGGTADDLKQARAAAVVVREPAAADPARGAKSLDDLLADAGLAGIAGVDTRELTQLVGGAQQGQQELEAQIKQFADQEA